MNTASARVGAGFLALVLIWIGVYWLWEPGGPPRVSFAAEERVEAPEPPATQVVEPAPQPEQAAQEAPPETPLAGPAAPVETVVEEAAAEEPFGPPPFREYVVRQGDTFERISRRVFGTGRHASAIAAANPFVSPRNLRPGQTVRVPIDPENVQGRPEGGVDPIPEPGFAEYTVVKGDTLSALAERFYGSTRYTDVIFNANAETMSSPDDLAVGDVLRIPSRESVLGDTGG